MERDTTEREAFLDDACAGHEELHSEVEFLLAAHEQVKESDDFLNQPALQVADLAIADGQAQSLALQRPSHHG